MNRGEFDLDNLISLGETVLTAIFKESYIYTLKYYESSSHSSNATKVHLTLEKHHTLI